MHIYIYDTENGRLSDYFTKRKIIARFDCNFTKLKRTVEKQKKEYMHLNVHNSLTRQLLTVPAMQFLHNTCSYIAS